MPKCNLLDIEMPIGKVCPSINNEDKDICFTGCGFCNDHKAWLDYWINKVDLS